MCLIAILCLLDLAPLIQTLPVFVQSFYLSFSHLAISLFSGALSFYILYVFLFSTPLSKRTDVQMSSETVANDKAMLKELLDIWHNITEFKYVNVIL